MEKKVSSLEKESSRTRSRKMQKEHETEQGFGLKKTFNSYIILKLFFNELIFFLFSPNL